MLDYREHRLLVRQGPRGCPVVGCANGKTSVDLVCRKHWYEVPKELRERIFELWRSGADKAEHRRLCLEVVTRLNEAATTTALGTVRRWADMTEAEQARIREQVKPPPPPSPGEAELRRRQAQAGLPVQVKAQRLVKETAKAVLFVVNGAEQWFPKSAIEEQRQQKDETWVLQVAAWFAKKEGLVDG